MVFGNTCARSVGERFCKENLKRRMPVVYSEPGLAKDYTGTTPFVGRNMFTATNTIIN